MKRAKRKLKNKISLGVNNRDILLAEYSHISVQSVENALAYRTDSDLARSIRKRAKQLLQEEAKKVKVELYED